ncbi:MAG: VOC family protein [Halobacteriales archaeon]
MPTLPAATSMGPVELAVRDADDVLSFYLDVVGLTVLERASYRVDLGAGDRVLVRLHEDGTKAPRPASAAGLFHLALRVPDRSHLARAARRLRGAGRLRGASDHLVSEALYSRDPDGNGVEIYHDRPRENWRRSADGGVRLPTWPLDVEALEAAASDPAGALPAGTRVGHVHLEVTDLQAAEAFYVDSLGFEVAYRAPRALFAAAGGYHHHLGLNTWNGRTERTSGRGLERFHVVLPAPADVDRLAARLADHPGLVGRPGDELVLRDRDGIEVVVAVDGQGL